MTQQLLTHVRIFDATGAEAFPGEVLVEDNRILAVRRGAEPFADAVRPAADAVVLDGDGATLMPGLINGHCHMSFTGEAPMGEIPPEEHVALTLHHARLALDNGFTAAVGAGAAKTRLDVVVRNEIRSGRFPGPRYLAASPEITVTGGLGDDRKLHLGHNHLAVVADGPDELRRVARLMIREGVDIVKLLISGDNLVDQHCDAETTAMTDAEVAAAAEVTLGRGKRLAAHARSSQSVQLCLRHGIHIINHATLIDDETMGLMEARKAGIFVMPALGFVEGVAHRGAAWGVTSEQAKARGFHHELEAGCSTMLRLHRRGIRVLPFGDYGFPWTPHGTECNDLLLFRDRIGMAPADILRAATQYGGELFGSGLSLGRIAPGYLADIILVDGDPVADLGLLVGGAGILLVMQDGRLHRNALGGARSARRAAA